MRDGAVGGSCNGCGSRGGRCEWGGGPKAMRCSGRVLWRSLRGHSGDGGVPGGREMSGGGGNAPRAAGRGRCRAAPAEGAGPIAGGGAHLQLAEREDLLPRDLHLGGTRRGRGDGRGQEVAPPPELPQRRHRLRDSASDWLRAFSPAPTPPPPDPSIPDPPTQTPPPPPHPIGPPTPSPIPTPWHPPAPHFPSPGPPPTPPNPPPTPQTHSPPPPSPPRPPLCPHDPHFVPPHSPLPLPASLRGPPSHSQHSSCSPR